MSASYPLPHSLCVPALLGGSLRALGNPMPSIVSLARHLGVVVPQDTPNPFGLPTTDDPDLTGITPACAEPAINAWLEGRGYPYRFRHVRENTVSLRDYLSLVHDIQSRGGVIAIGFDYSAVFGGERLSRHVARLGPSIGDTATLLDDSQTLDPDPVHVPWPDLERAMVSVRGGFWSIGPPDTLHTPFALPWTPGWKST